ncbi:unnamed protein product [Polarella glacialis]|uniref:tRNA-dihydrouridine(16/17) synthase [NAD(P)(+)] n=1 Tax=Polarella glacialis TaxID=89957 RepID=A0A813GS98_POLGL|nr:unnamed protein product [Polarella glacialis]
MTSGQECSARPLPCGLVAPVYTMAPMVKQSDRPFRALLREHGCTLCYTEMFMADKFATCATYRRRALGDGVDKDDHPLIVQFAANDKDILLKAALEAQAMGADGIDLNLGCPQPRAREGGYGAHFAHDTGAWAKIAEMVRTCASDPELRIPIFCKIRLQPTVSATIKFASMLEDAGCALLAIHGRKLLVGKSKARDGPADLGAVAAVRSALRAMPVLSNGNVRCPADVCTNLASTRCEGIMCAEQLLKDPALFERAAAHSAKAAGSIPARLPSAEELVEEYLGLCCDFDGEDDAHCFSVWGASNGHVVREHVNRMSACVVTPDQPSAKVGSKPQEGPRPNKRPFATLVESSKDDDDATP